MVCGRQAALLRMLAKISSRPLRIGSQLNRDELRKKDVFPREIKIFEPRERTSPAAGPGPWPAYFIGRAS
jgi:hypothetical protein